ncbi:16S rRNA (guanine(527)-N(7))-methyltransferase RsmG [Thioalkalivibrio sp. ALJ16]|uniref:16S rRNA (guanine(527)-N(7))-methyltransferase RsmG n=1 Tax=Thioalkalivibrio sp. ALJ16 TaxID=1158762 RepID=UPI0003609C6A|nr:16S rRNA (guanine(527)-N(7))-methyltransferase RsmG [Thioalkalivibrio sp. ALJ16]
MASEVWATRLQPYAEAWGLDARACEVLAFYLDELLRWNRVHNLTAVRDPAQLIPRHVLDSLTLSPYLHGDRVLDVGTGAGLPGFVLAVVERERSFCLLDSAAKRIRFLRNVIGRTGLHHVEAIHARIEDFHPDAPYTTVLSRAFKAPADMLARVEHTVAPGGRVLAMLGQRRVVDEPLPGPWSYQRVDPVTIPGETAERHVAIIERT